MCRGLLRLLFHATEMPNTKCMGKFAIYPVSLGHLTSQNFHELEHHCICSELLYMYQIRKVTEQTRRKQYTIINLIFNGFFSRNVLDMSVPAGIFAMNKSIANVSKLLDMCDHNYP